MYEIKCTSTLFDFAVFDARKKVVKFATHEMLTFDKSVGFLLHIPYNGDFFFQERIKWRSNSFYVSLTILSIAIFFSTNISQRTFLKHEAVLGLFFLKANHFIFVKNFFIYNTSLLAQDSLETPHDTTYHDQ